MNWHEYLLAGETLHWEGCPMPRCYVFKRWKQTLFGIPVLALSGYWFFQGMYLAASGYPFWLPLLPLPFIFAGYQLSIGQLFSARRRWEKLYYAISDLRVLRFDNHRVTALELCNISYFKLNFHGKQLGSLEIFAGSTEHRLTLECIEYPTKATALLEAAMSSSGQRLAAPECASKAVDF